MISIRHTDYCEDYRTIWLPPHIRKPTFYMVFSPIDLILCLLRKAQIALRSTGRVPRPFLPGSKD